MTFEERVSRVSSRSLEELVELLHDSPAGVCRIPLDFEDKLATILRFLRDTKWEVNRIERFVTGQIENNSESTKESDEVNDSLTPEGRAQQWIFDTLTIPLENWILDHIPNGQDFINWIKSTNSDFVDFSPIWQRLLIYWDLGRLGHKVDNIAKGLFGSTSWLDAFGSNLKREIAEISETLEDIADGKSETDEILEQLNSKITECCVQTQEVLHDILRRVIECCPITRLDTILDRLDIIDEDILNIRASLRGLTIGRPAISNLAVESLSKVILSNVLEIRRLLSQ